MLKICGFGVRWMDAGRWWDGGVRKNRSTWRKTCPISTSSNTNFTRTGLRSNPILRDVRPATAWPIRQRIATYVVTSLLNPYRRVVEKLAGSHLLKKFPACIASRKFITAFTICPSLVLILSSYLCYMNITDYYAQSGICCERWKLRTYSLVCPEFTGLLIQGSLCTNTKSIVDERKLILCFLY